MLLLRMLAAVLVLHLLTAAAPAWAGEVQCGDAVTPSKATRATLKISSRLDDGKWVSGGAAYPRSDQRVSLKVKAAPDARVKWYLIFADLGQNYKNANRPGERDAYKWVGFGKIRYCRMELTGARDQAILSPFKEKLWKQVATNMPDFAKRFYHERLGTFWFQAAVTRDDKVKRSAGIEDADHRGLSPKVFRVSIRRSDDFLGHLTSFFNVPGVFGSVIHQSRYYLGVDCADVLATARARWKGLVLDRNYNVDMLTTEFKIVAELDLEGGSTSKQIRWGKDVRPGDLVAVRYGGGKRYQHVGALWEDADRNGLLNGLDRAIHVGPDAMHFTRLAGAFTGHLLILRP